MHKKSISWLCLSIMCAMSTVHANQQIVYDGELTWTGDKGDGWKAIEWQGDANWEDLGYYSGEFYVRIEVTEMEQDPVSSDFYFQICCWDGGEMCMSNGDLKWKTKGVYSGNQAPSDWWTKSSASFNDHYDEMKPVLKYANKWADARSKSFCYGPGISSVTPLTMRLTVITATSGEAADISSFDWPCPSNWDCQATDVTSHVNSFKKAASGIRVTQNAIVVDDAVKNATLSLYTPQGKLLTRVNTQKTQKIDVGNFGTRGMCIAVMQTPNGGHHSQPVCIR